jgi:acetyltransferase-like isoleucine patch superfamily enzyme
LGHHCIVGEKTVIAYNVRIGNHVKINSFVYIPTGVTIEDKVMISAGCVFVNDRYPRAFDLVSGRLADSGPNEETLSTTVREGATLGAGCTILADLEIGRYALVGAGSVVTKSVPEHALMVGNPARQVGWVCLCGQKLSPNKKIMKCARCGKMFTVRNKKLSIHTPNYLYVGQ